MTYLLTQIVLCLTAVAFFGVALGWLFGSSLSRGRVRGVEENWSDRLAEVETKLSDARTRAGRQEVALAESRAALDDKEGAFSQLRDRFEAAQLALDESRVRIAGLEFDAETLKNRLRDAESGLAAAATSVEERERRVELAETQILQADARANELAEEARRWRKRAAELEPVVGLHETLRVQHQRLRNDHEALILQNQHLESQVRAHRDRPAATPTLRSHLHAAESKAEGAIDDLKRIRGIGAVLESKLRALGFQTFSDIAAMTPEQISRVAAELEGFGDRITRDRWIDQARTLMGE